MLAIRVLGWLYVAVYLAVGVVIALGNAPELIGYVWVPFGSTTLVFHLSAPRETGWSRATCGLIVSAISAVAAGMAVLSVIALADELNLASEGLTTAAAWTVGGGLALTVLVLMTARTIDKLRPHTRARGLIELAAAPSIVVVAAAALSGAVLVATPNMPDVFLEGLVAMISLFWCGLAAAWLAGAWLIALRARARLAPPPLPPARVTSARG